MTKEQNSKTVLIIVAIILGILLIGGMIIGGTCYWLYKVGTKSSPSSSPATISTAQWLPYENARFGFSLKYPPTFTATESQNGDGITLTTSDPAITIRAYGSMNALSQGLDEYLNWVRENLFKETENAEEILAEEVTLGKDKISAQERQWTYKNPIDGSLILHDQTTALKNNTFYSIEMVVADSDHDEYATHVFDNILQSFKIK